MNVVDASVLVEYLAGGEHGEAAGRRSGGSAGSGLPPWSTPRSATRCGARCAARKSARARPAHALEDFLDMRLQRVPHRALVERAWQLRDNVSFYDALYVALAEESGRAAADPRRAARPSARVCAPRSSWSRPSEAGPPA